VNVYTIQIKYAVEGSIVKDPIEGMGSLHGTTPVRSNTWLT